MNGSEERASSVLTQAISALRVSPRLSMRMILDAAPDRGACLTMAAFYHFLTTAAQTLIMIYSPIATELSASLGLDEAPRHSFAMVGLSVLATFGGYASVVLAGHTALAVFDRATPGAVSERVVGWWLVATGLLYLPLTALMLFAPIMLVFVAILIYFVAQVRVLALFYAEALGEKSPPAGLQAACVIAPIVYLCGLMLAMVFLVAPLSALLGGLG